MAADIPTTVRPLLVRIKANLTWRWNEALKTPGRILNKYLGNLWYDLWLKRTSRISKGSLLGSKRCAVYVLYPRMGLQASHLASLTYLVEKGFTPLVVSNLRLAPQEREALLPLCWQLVERPNYGYDFGAYRDGILLALDLATGMHQLVLANDSAWFPIPAASDWLAQAEQLNVDLAGAASNDGLVGYLAGANQKVPWKIDPTAPRLHYCSFALLIGSRILSDPDFRQFWQKLKLTSDKYLTIQRGEVGLSRWIIARGYSHAATLDLTRFDRDLQQMNTASLSELAAHLIIPEDVELRQRQLSLVNQPDTQSDPETLRSFILWATAATGPAYALPTWSLPERDFGFLKKSPLWLSKPTALITLKLLERYGSASMLDEAKQLARGETL